MRGKKIQIQDNMSTLERLTLCASELCGTAILLFVGCGGCIDFSEGVNPPSDLSMCLSFGLGVLIAVQCYAHISVSHINPAVTLVSFTLGNISLVAVPIYITGQILGAIAGMGMLKMATPHHIYGDTKNASVVGLCSPHINPMISPLQGLFIEFMITLILALTCCGVWDERNSKFFDSVAIRFGLTITGLALVGGPYTGANMNPARSFAPALINGNWDNHWVYWVGPLSGAVSAGLLYRLIFMKCIDVDKDAPEGIPLNDKA